MKSNLYDLYLKIKGICGQQLYVIYRYVYFFVP
jgi:hypothetical protein